MPPEMTVTSDGVSIDSPLGKIKGIPLSALGWVGVLFAFGFMLFKLTGSFEQSLIKMEGHMGGIAVESAKQTVLLEKILDKD